MPDVAAALRDRREAIVRRWEEAVQRQLPEADPLTRQEVRDTLPVVLDVLAEALAGDQPEPTKKLHAMTREHGIVRFDQKYNIYEVITEYRLLRRIAVDEIDAALERRMTPEQVMAVDMGIDVALQQGVTAFVNHQADQLRAANEARSKFLAFLSHDLRNNLSGVTLTMELLVQRLRGLPEFAEDVEDIGRLHRQVMETVHGMERLLHMERLRTAVGQARQDPIPLRQFLADLVTQSARRAADKGIKLEAEVGADVTIHGDRELIGLILQNLLGNAVKYSEGGLVRIEAHAEGHGGWLISVSDQGPGIAPDDLQRLFQAFKRGQTHGQEGVGLGLSIASEAARAMGAELSVESQVGRGSTFRLRLPPRANL